MIENVELVDKLFKFLNILLGVLLKLPMVQPLILKVDLLEKLFKI